MNQAELVIAVAGASVMTHGQVDGVLKALAAVTQEILSAGGEISLPGIGKLSVKTRAARNAFNPRTREPIAVPAKKVPHFSAAKALKDTVGN